MTDDVLATEESTPVHDQTTSGSDDTTIGALQAEIAQLRDQLARSQADYQNMMRRNREESLQIGQWSEDKIITKFLTILDNLERSLEHIPTEMTGTSWAEGIVSIVRSMQKLINDL